MGRSGDWEWRECPGTSGGWRENCRDEEKCKVLGERKQRQGQNRGKKTGPRQKYDKYLILLHI